MKFSLKIKNRSIELNIEEDLSPVEVNYIETMIENDISRLEKETPDTLKILSNLVAKYCVEYFITKKKLQNVSSNIEEKVDNLIRILRENSSGEKLF